MTSKSDRSFPCIFCLSERFSDQGHGFQQRPESDYVFFSPTMGFKRSDARSLEVGSQGTTTPQGVTGISGAACGWLSGNRLDRGI